MRSEQPEEEIPDDEIGRALRRNSVAEAGIEVLVWDAGEPGHAEGIGKGLVQMIKARQRPAAFRLLPSRASEGEGPTLEAAIATATHDLILITSATRPWSAAHLDPLLEAIEKADHVVGRRPATWFARIRRRLGWAVRALVYAVPIVDLHSPCRLHRRAYLAQVPLQSESAFVDLELLAKATFLTQLITEVPVPALPSDDEDDSRRRALWRHDRGDFWR
jgi:hypothetical protein